MTQAELMLAHALGELGVREVPGPRSHPRIDEYYRAAGLRPDEAGELGSDDSTTPWCGCFAAWVVAQCGFEPPRHPYRARNWMQWGYGIDVPRPGCIVVLSRGRPWQGHVGFYVGHTADRGDIALLGGNQGNAVSVALYSAKRVLGYRHPEGLCVA